jgi:hypothetical protein
MEKGRVAPSLSRARRINAEVFLVGNYRYELGTQISPFGTYPVPVY